MVRYRTNVPGEMVRVGDENERAVMSCMVVRRTGTSVSRIDGRSVKLRHGSPQRAHPARRTAHSAC